MAFPISPTDGQIYTTAFGSRYRYYAADDKWVKDGFVVQGNQGETGAQGETGFPGATGIQGPQGSQGETGFQGETGGQGGQGETGLQGETGISAGQIESINFIIDGGGQAIETGLKGYIRIYQESTIEQADLLGGETGAIQVDIWKTDYNNYPPTDSDSITASAPLSFTGAIKSTDSTLTGWTKTINAGDILGYNVDIETNITRVTVALKLSRSS